MEDKLIKINNYAVKFIPKIDELNQFEMLVYSPTENEFFIINKSIYTILNHINENKQVLISELIQDFPFDNANLNILYELIDKGILIEAVSI